MRERAHIELPSLIKRFGRISDLLTVAWSPEVLTNNVPFLQKSEKNFKSFNIEYYQALISVTVISISDGRIENKMNYSSYCLFINIQSSRVEIAKL